MHCPLCNAQVPDHEAYLAHLGLAHGIVDDPGKASPPPPAGAPRTQPWYSNAGAPEAWRPVRPPPPSHQNPLPPAPPKSQARHAVGWAAVGAAVLIIVGAALWVSSSGSSGSKPETFTTVPSTTRLVDPGKAAKVNVQPTDLPAGWTTGQPAIVRPAGHSVAVAAFACLGVQPPEPKLDVRSYTYNSPDGVARVASEVTSADVDSQHQYVAAMSGPKGAECLQAGLPGVYANQDFGINVDSVTVDTVRPVDGADEGTVYRATVTIDDRGIRRELISDIFSFRVGPVVVETAVTSDSSSDPTALRDSLLQAQLDRAHALVG